MDAATPSPSVHVKTLVRDALGTWSLDPAASTEEFHVKHFWGVITVHGHFERIEGEATVDEAGMISGNCASMPARSPRRTPNMTSTCARRSSSTSITTRTWS
jgi:YceI-like domain